MRRRCAIKAGKSLRNKDREYVDCLCDKRHMIRLPAMQSRICFISLVLVVSVYFLTFPVDSHHSLGWGPSLGVEWLGSVFAIHAVGF